MPLLQTVRDALVSERERLFSELQQIPYLEPYPSHANFILCKVSRRALLCVPAVAAVPHPAVA